jgi:uncharacterized protein YjbI with pentapeptide repeats
METKQVRGVKVLLPSQDEAVATSWPHAETLGREKLSNTRFESVDLSSHRWTDVSVSRCRFVGCRMMGFTVTGGTFADVLFERCRIDYAVFSRVKATGSVAFVDCTFTDAEFSGGDLSGTVFAGCDLRGAAFEAVKLVGADLRGSEVSGLSGVGSLKGAEMTEGQLTDLFMSLAAELELKLTRLEPDGLEGG